MHGKKSTEYKRVASDGTGGLCVEIRRRRGSMPSIPPVVVLI